MPSGLEPTSWTLRWSFRHIEVKGWIQLFLLVQNPLLTGFNMCLGNLVRELSLADRALHPRLLILSVHERLLALERLQALRGGQFHLVGAPWGDARFRRPVDYVLALRDVGVSYSLVEVTLAVRAVYYVFGLGALRRVRGNWV
jgi:hypothetical protein